MKLRSILSVSASIAFAATSCTPYVDPVPEPPQDPAKRTVSSDEQQKIKERREEKKKEDEAAGRKENAARENPDSQRQAEKPKERTGTGSSSGGGESSTTKPASYPVAIPIPGKPGFVLSPFNNKPIDVKDIPSGKLVADPTYPASEKKYFRVP